MILIIADIHFDMWRRDERDPFDGIARTLTDLDAVIIAGDLGNDAIKHWPRALDRLGKLIAPEKIWVMPGNHDYWHGALAMDGELERITCDLARTSRRSG